MLLDRSMKVFLTSSLGTLLLLGGCKTSAGDSGTKDLALSSSNLNDPEAVIWQSNDNMVHYAQCPTAPANRTCPSLVEKVAPVPLATYKDKIAAAIINQRPKQTNSANMTYSQINVLRTKIKRLTEKLANGGIQAADQATINTQLAGYNAEMAKLVALTPAEQKIMDDVESALQAGKDVTLDEGEEKFVYAILPFGLGLERVSTLPLTPPGTTNNPLEIAKLLDAWNEEAEMFYGANPIYTQGSTGGIMQEPLTTCLSACPPYYSDLTCHFYCWHPSYKAVVPNVRGCFTNIARDQTVKKPNGQPINMYPQVFDYCMFQEYDVVLNSIPAYDEGLIKQRKSSNRASDRVGVLKYMSPKQEDAFKYVMFNWYNPFAFALADQQAILDKFYAAHPNVNVPHVATAQGKANHPKYAPILGFMQAEYASGGLGPVPQPATGAGTATSCGAGAKLIDGYCWYLGAAGDSCDTTCSKVNLKASAETLSYIGSAGTDQNCGKVAAAFGQTLTVNGATNCPAQGCAKCDGTCAAPLTNAVFRCANPATLTATQTANVQPFCSCK